MILFSGSLTFTVHTFILFFVATNSFPINNGFSVKFNPMSKEDMKTKRFGTIFAKNPQEFNSKNILSNEIFRYGAGSGLGSSNHVMKLLFPIKGPCKMNESKLSDEFSFLNIPMIRQPVDDYKVIVAAAPKNVRIGRGEEAKPLVVYIVFPDDDSNDIKSLNMPTIYFVSKPDSRARGNEKAEPIFIIDSNRTVTGLKSNAVSKFVTFKNRFRIHS